MKSIVRQNAEADPNYNPYCMRCSGLVRMRKVGPMHWKCSCGAEHVEPDNLEDTADFPAVPTFNKDQMLRLISSDRFLSFSWERFGNEDQMLEVLFNTYVLEDSVMTAEYHKHKGPTP